MFGELGVRKAAKIEKSYGKPSEEELLQLNSWKKKIFGGRATYGIILGQVINTWKDGCGGDRDHSFVLERVGQVRLGRALPGRAKSAGGLKAGHFDSHFVFLKFSTSTAGFCPNRKASSRSTGPGGLAAAGSSHSKREAASNLHLQQFGFESGFSCFQ